LVFTVIPVAAQEDTSTWISIPTPIQGEVGDGDVICATDEGYKRCENEYDTGMYGVVDLDPAASFEIEGSGLVPVMTNGQTEVRVTGKGGNIESGDLITSAEDDGLAMKATRNGYVLGVAQGGFSPANPDDTGTIKVIVDIHPTTLIGSARTDIISFLRRGISLAALDSLTNLRYIIAALLLLISFALGFMYFGRVARSGIEAMGRNPLAGRAIQLSVFFNVVITICIFAAGVIGAYLILVL
jgi:hypothetical protein